ncbi:MAG: lipopolysaccharide biosynthesis protein [Muribaculaceae bacterium]|nr:lipopolysaccharide biosynthesis protein [Muribaculaceae bacterium]
MQPSLKHLTARSIKWNIVDRVSSQLLYAVTGIILARELPREAFGLIGALTIFQSYALMMVDSGFSYALIQRKRPTDTDYSSVFWFNLFIAGILYAILWFCAPLIADIFQGDERLIPLSRVMFLSFIINATAIVQTNRLTKQMNFRPIAITNVLGLIAGGVVGVWLAMTGYGAWAIVWQTIALQGIKSISLWIYCRWWPQMAMSWQALRSFFKIGGNMMMTTFLYVTFQNIYSFFIGNKVGMVPLGYYTQADKWSKLGVSSLTQVLTSSFLPALSEVQDDEERYRRVVSKMNRFTAYMLFPCMIFLIVIATPMFHVLFGTKWDASIILFQLLLVRGIFTVISTLYNNYILSLGKSRAIFWLEVLRDSAALIGIIVALPYISLSTYDNAVYGLTILLLGQVVASAITWVATLIVTAKITKISAWSYCRDLLPYLVLSLIIGGAISVLASTSMCDLALLIIQGVAALSLYLGANTLFPSKIQRDVFGYLTGRHRSL